MTNQAVVLGSYTPPGRSPSVDQFVVQPAPEPEAGPGRTLVETLYLSVDPYMRGRMTGMKRRGYPSPFLLGAPVVSEGVARVMASDDPRFRVGEVVVGMLPWMKRSILDESQSIGHETRTVHPSIANVRHALGGLGAPGLVAFFGITRVARPEANETVMISAAAGGVGSVASQIARLQGARVIGLAGGERKVKLLTDELGLDAALDYRSPRLEAEILDLCPSGPDVYFDSVGGSTSQTVMWTMRAPARVIECGQIASYNDPAGGWVVDIYPIHRNGLTLRGFTSMEFAGLEEPALAQLSRWVDTGQIKLLETVHEGLESAPQAFVDLFSGGNVGKMIVQVGA